jgi:hypothetical protein
MSDFSPQERQALINMYLAQYNQTNLHIERLLDTLDDIRINMNNLIGNNMNRSNRFPNRFHRHNNRHNSSNPNPNHNPNPNSNSRRPYIYYDFSNPIDRSTYISDETNNSNQDITNFLTTFLNSSVTVCPSQEQINNASRLVRYSDISNPSSTSCVISLEPFTLNDNVRQLHHCGHIFFPDQFNQWFSNHVRCPICRHDIRNYTNSNNNNNSNNSTNNNNLEEIPITPIQQLAVDLSNNEISDNLLSTISNRLFSSLLNHSSSNPSDRFVFDPSNNILLFETILRANNQQT